MSARLFALLAAAALLAPLGGAATSGQPVNDLPNGYRTIRDWAMPPGGIPWAAVTAVEVAKNGDVYVIHRCNENSCVGRMEPPILKFDKSGKLLRPGARGCSTFRMAPPLTPTGTSG
jgi:hypothetical protein